MKLWAVSAAALHFLAPPSLPQIGGENSRWGERAGLPYRQELGNFHNVQYHAKLEIGGQPVSGIFDTGSFEIVVVSTRCAKCPHPEYNHSASTTYVSAGREEHLHQYGSGPTLSRLGYEHVSVGPLVAWNQTFYEMLDHNISALDDASFDAIVGIGGAGDEGGNHSLLHSLGVKEYSVCLEDGHLRPGWLTWGGDLEDRSTALEMPVIGEHHWAVALTGVLPRGADLSQEHRDAAGVLLCKDGCAAVLDSGTSLIAAPSFALQGLGYLLPPVHENCSNFADMPTLELQLGGHRVLLPPEAYVFRMQGTIAEANSVWDMLYFKPKVRSLNECMLAFMPMDRRTKYGPLWILGMPFFRTYHVQFDGRTSERRAWVSNADAQCRPQPLTAEPAADRPLTDDAPFPDMVVSQAPSIAEARAQSWAPSE